MRGDGGSSERVPLRHHDPHLALEHFKPGAVHFETSFLSSRGCRIGLTEIVNGSEWTGSNRHTDKQVNLIYKSNSVCLSMWAVPGRFFQSLHIPCGASPYVTSPDVIDSREKRNQGSLIFWGKRFSRPKKKYLGLRQPRIFFSFFFVLTKTTFFFF